MTIELARQRIGTGTDVVAARSRIHDAARTLGVDPVDRVRLGIAVTHWADRLITAGSEGTLVLQLESSSLLVTMATDAPSAEQAPLRQRLPRPPADETVAALRDRSAEDTSGLVEALRAQDEELLTALVGLANGEEELLRLTEELQETNRGVVALYAELDERGGQLREASTAKSRFLASVSHELRSPLNSVVALAGLLREADSDPLTADQDEQVRLIQSAAAQLLGLVNDLLDLAKAESGALQPLPADVDVAALITDVCSVLRPMTAPDVELVCADPGPLPPIVTDATLVGQVVRNLVGNALKFTERGTVTVAASVTGDVLAISVADTGVGIAPEHHQLVFDEFFQVPGRLQSRVKGTGLGLSYARRVAAALGGALELASAPGTGSTFTMTLPVRPTVPAAAEADSARIGTVLIVDDEPVFRQALRRLLPGPAPRIVEAEDAQSALAMMHNVHPDLVLLDLHMPGGGGDVVLRQMAVDDTLRSIPVVVVTSATPEENRADDAVGGRPVLAKTNLTEAGLSAAIRTARRQGSP